MDVLAGARDDRHLNDLRRLLARASIVPVRAMDYEEGAALFRVCRRRGETVRRLIDCLIAAAAIRADIPLLHADADYEVLARHTALRIDRLECHRAGSPCGRAAPAVHPIRPRTCTEPCSSPR